MTTKHEETSSSHTPGPWGWKDDELLRLDTSGSGHAFTSDPAVLHWNSVDGLTVTEPDARLIAAAPDLLATLEALFTTLHHDPDCEYGTPCRCRYGQTLAAIAKAHGGGK